MLRILEIMSEDNLISVSVTKDIAKKLVDENYDYSLEDYRNIPDVINHSAEVIEPMKANTLLNKNNNIKISYDSKTFPIPELNSFFNS
ncbi:hypothetical protein FE773_04775 [Caminibacter mediatlanticus TB-2]|uniref:Uncharacterized protein n=1 Tax=Caminibacter mediatlanticus TB-2 TaxID=391592 RepID=A0ABX5VAA0_9BACT|nr:hypothetical protein [Caminibacter mediatlanticus]QCT94514.1 hypothetical protein FE773_04775 [Caminibacter mediatlanticus TB-2]